MITIEKTKLNGVKLIKPVHFEDHRGEYLQIYNEKEYKEQLTELTGLDFVEEDISIATKHVIKGIHGDYNTWKLVSCLYGKIYLIVIDYSMGDHGINNKQFGKWQAFTLSDVNKVQILIPPGFGNGHMCMTDKSIYHYKQTSYYNLDGQFTITWNNDRFDFWWPVKNPIVSLRDETGEKSYVGKQ